MMVEIESINKLLIGICLHVLGVLLIYYTRNMVIKEKQYLKKYSIVDKHLSYGIYIRLGGLGITFAISGLYLIIDSF